MNYSTIEKHSIDQTKAILPGAPWAIAHKSMLQINKPTKIILNNRDYVIWKDKSDRVFALDNVCPHMQAPLSDGWICQERNTIACPFHGLEFNDRGQLLQDKKATGKSLLSTLDLIIEGDIIWSYGNYNPKIPVPNLIPRLTEDYTFLGVAGEKTIQAPFLKCLKINYDFNHAIATHREPFKFDRIETYNFQTDGYYQSLDQDVFRVNNDFWQLLKNPVLLSIPPVLSNHFEYSFPSTTGVISQTFLGTVVQFFIIYPETATTTKTFILVYIKPKNLLAKFLLPLLKNYFLTSFDLIVEQDSQIVENLYPDRQPKIRLPREEIMFYAEKLYQEWTNE